uniref:BED-type domain-containing protein n=1 Tax=Vaucheria litorea TaxID=109269 RepID=H6WB99_VAULI|nr:hypothetical protein [Vaucheria litorea]
MGRTRKAIWEHFSDPLRMEGAKVPRTMCNHCSSSVSATTTNMTTHLKNCSTLAGIRIIDPSLSKSRVIHSELIQSNKQMETLKSSIKDEGKVIREIVPSLIKELDKILQYDFSYTDLLSIEKTFADDVLANASQNQPQVNEKLCSLISLVRSKMVLAINTLFSLKMWIRAHVPAIEDGNNFGVGVQYEVTKNISESIEKLQAAFNTLPEYHEKRSAVWEKLIGKSETVTKKSTGNEDKSTVTQSTDESNSTGKQLPDSLRTIVALDLKCYVNLHSHLQLSRDSLFFSANLVELNIGKLVAPKGEADRRAANLMY